VAGVSFTCSCCGKEHEGLPDLAFGAPEDYVRISAEEKETIAKKADDLCSINDEQFFVRGILMVPIAGSDAEFGWGVWVSLNREDFYRYIDLYDAEDARERYVGALRNSLPGYPDTLSLPVDVHLQPYPDRPKIVVHESDHPLSVHQREGIELDALQRIVESYLHPSGVR
jgi:hypothetical protein